MKYVMGLVLMLLFTTYPCYAQEHIVRVVSPVEVTTEVSAQRGLPKELEGLAWNRWTSDNFVVCSLNDMQAQYLHKHLELVKGWVLARWGLYDVSFSSPCKLICVDSPDLFKKLFNIESTQVEVRRDANGKIKETVIFLLIKGLPSETVPVPLTEVCLAEFAQRYNTVFANWAYKGIAELNGSIDQINVAVAGLKPMLDRNDPIFFSKGIFETDRVTYAKLTLEQQRLYNHCAAVICLMIRKEHGQDKFLRFLKQASESNPELAVKEVLGFTDYSHLDRTFKRYLIDLSDDAAAGNIPAHYLQVREVN